MSTQGHPRHQIREFTVSYKRSTNGHTSSCKVMAQTEDDAILRAGMLLAARYRPVKDAAGWASQFIVTGVEDPAPLTWQPPGSASGKSYCTNPEHGHGEHDASCCPPADPSDPELRLLRAIFGLCGLCDVEDAHSHVPEDRP
jgi:hypothetical protein